MNRVRLTPADMERVTPVEDEVTALIQMLQHAEARESYWAFRCLMDPELIIGWWQYDAATHLQKFFHDWEAGKRPVLIISAPPQHGKSDLVEDFLAWLAGRNPHLSLMYASYSDELGSRCNMSLQRTFGSEIYNRVFPRTRIVMAGERTHDRYVRNTTQIQFVGHRGSFRNTTVQGQVTGMRVDIGVLDDPIKGRQEAHSKSIRDRTFEWVTDDFLSRFSDKAGLIIIMTRWHVDDPVGRLLVKFPQATVLKYQAIAEEDEQYRKKGEALFPEFKSLDFLNTRREVYTAASWASLYQQEPYVQGGGLFPTEKFRPVQNVPRDEIKMSVRYWDKAGTTDGGAYTAGVLMHQLKNGVFFIEDVKRGQWSALERERHILQTAKIDFALYKQLQIWCEQEPGSGGKESAEATVRMLAGYRAFADRVTGKKEVRAEPYAAQVQGGNVMILTAGWNRDFLEEHESFPSGTYKDQVDASSGAFIKLAGSTYDSSLSWVG